MVMHPAKMTSGVHTRWASFENPAAKKVPADGRTEAQKDIRAIIFMLEKQ